MAVEGGQEVQGHLLGIVPALSYVTSQICGGEKEAILDQQLSLCPMV